MEDHKKQSGFVKGASILNINSGIHKEVMKMSDEREKEYRTTAPGRESLVKKDNGWIDQQAMAVRECASRVYNLRTRVDRLVDRLIGPQGRPEKGTEEVAKSNNAFARFGDEMSNLDDNITMLEATVGMLEDINLA